ncbi:hypothetical protein QJS10_CPB13g01399 [Acorus calamus]|uniref:Uncharacterized protein n=1 Tax=Acorus calamus TaxID=4465 RepID=A0AAV9DJW0_ACOCL|nr:hypothetical protein QJS10_CPB13g01399 [Acorus calamus]
MPVVASSPVDGIFKGYTFNSHQGRTSGLKDFEKIRNCKFKESFRDSQASRGCPMHSRCAHHRILQRPLLEIFQSPLHLLPSQQQQQCTDNSCDKDLDRRRLFNDPMRHFLGD